MPSASIERSESLPRMKRRLTSRSACITRWLKLPSTRVACSSSASNLRIKAALHRYADPTFSMKN
jgi:hypothetical protein